jgi:CheY-like chemotaxis protein
MSRYHIHPFYFPTTVALVDDSANFLTNLSLLLDSSLAYRLFDSPLDALASINAGSSRAGLTQKYFSTYAGAESLSGSNRVIDLDVGKIRREVYNENRFDEISVAVVDYAMPELDGLEFCRNLKRPAVKKILLTGRADEKLAVSAFNAGLIDRFILKSDAMALANLNQAIAELQHEYFYELETIIADALTVGTESLLHDSLFAEFFRTICRERRVVESYLCSNPDGFLMLDARGAGTLLLIYTEKDLHAQYEMAFDQAAPQALLDQLKSGKYVPYFWQSGGYYDANCANWADFIYPASELRGQQWYYYALVENPLPLKLETVLSYDAFLQALDREGQWAQPPLQVSTLQR